MARSEFGHPHTEDIGSRTEVAARSHHDLSANVESPGLLMNRGVDRARATDLKRQQVHSRLDTNDATDATRHAAARHRGAGDAQPDDELAA